MFEKLLNTIKEMYISKQERKKLELQRKIDLETKQHDLQMKRADLEMEYASKGKSMPDNLDRLSMEQMEKSYKDEIIMFILFSPIVMTFISYTQSTAKVGFEILNTSIPEWYVWLLISIVVVTYGLRNILRWILSKKIGK